VVAMSAGGGGVAAGNVNLSKMIRLDQVEELLNNMMARLDSQEQTIVSLQRLCTSLLTKNSANEVFDGIHQTLESLNSRLDRVQLAASAEMGNDQVMPAGELAYINSVDIRALKATLQECSRRAEVSQDLATLKTELSANVEQLRSQTTPLDVGRALQEAQSNAAQRMTGVETMLACKVDRSDVATLQTLASRLETYSAFLERTQATFAEHAREHTTLASRIDANTANLAALDTSMSEVRADLLTKSAATLTVQIQRDVDALVQQVRLCATSKGLASAEDKIGGILQRLAAKDTLDAETDRRIVAATKDIANRATLEQNRACVLRSHFDDTVTALGNDLETKADDAAFRALVDRVGLLGTVQGSEAQKLQVAMRFVDWFTSRGENYEHNLKLVDKHLRNLAVAANPADRAPFEGQIRFAPFMPPAGEL